MPWRPKALDPAARPISPPASPPASSLDIRHLSHTTSTPTQLNPFQGRSSNTRFQQQSPTSARRRTRQAISPRRPARASGRLPTQWPWSTSLIRRPKNFSSRTQSPLQPSTCPEHSYSACRFNNRFRNSASELKIKNKHQHGPLWSLGSAGARTCTAYRPTA